MPIYNGIEYFTESFNSIILQTFTEWELIIAINGHSPNSNIYNFVIFITSKYPQLSNKIKIFDFHHISGKSNTLNAMLKHCKYNYVSLLDVDDIWLKNKLEKQIIYLDEYDVIGSKCMYFNTNGETADGPDLPVGDFTDFNFKLFNPMINSSSVIRKKLCYWDNSLNGVEDYDLWFRLKRNGKKFYNCSEVLVKHRLHDNSAFNSNGNSSMVEELLNKY